MLDVITGAVMWKPDQPKTRKPRSRDLACPHCGEVHPIRRLDYCTGCGELRNETILEPADQTATDAPSTESPMSANLADIKRDAPPPIPVARAMSANLADIATPDEPDWLKHAPPLDGSIAGAWLHAQPMPGFKPTPVDRWSS
jgi:hypothetical protein